MADPLRPAANIADRVLNRTSNAFHDHAEEDQLSFDMEAAAQRAHVHGGAGRGDEPDDLDEPEVGGAIGDADHEADLEVDAGAAGQVAGATPLGRFSPRGPAPVAHAAPEEPEVEAAPAVNRLSPRDEVVSSDAGTGKAAPVAAARPFRPVVPAVRSRTRVGGTVGGAVLDSIRGVAMAQTTPARRSMVKRAGSLALVIAGLAVGKHVLMPGGRAQDRPAVSADAAGDNHRPFGSFYTLSSSAATTAHGLHGEAARGAVVASATLHDQMLERVKDPEAHLAVVMSALEQSLNTHNMEKTRSLLLHVSQWSGTTPEARQDYRLARTLQAAYSALLADARARQDEEAADRWGSRIAALQGVVDRNQATLHGEGWTRETRNAVVSSLNATRAQLENLPLGPQFRAGYMQALRAASARYEILSGAEVEARATDPESSRARSR